MSPVVSSWIWHYHFWGLFSCCCRDGTDLRDVLSRRAARGAGETFADRKIFSPRVCEEFPVSKSCTCFIRICVSFSITRVSPRLLISSRSPTVSFPYRIDGGLPILAMTFASDGGSLRRRPSGGETSLLNMQGMLSLKRRPISCRMDEQSPSAVSFSSLLPSSVSLQSPLQRLLQQLLPRHSHMGPEYKKRH